VFDRFIQMMDKFKVQSTEYKVKKNPETLYSKP